VVTASAVLFRVLYHLKLHDAIPYFALLFPTTPPFSPSNHHTMTTTSAPDDEYITLESSDKFLFVIHRDVACLSGTIKNMLSSGTCLSPCFF
jgi:hypothetical protein